MSRKLECCPHTLTYHLPRRVLVALRAEWRRALDFLASCPSVRAPYESAYVDGFCRAMEILGLSEEELDGG